MGDTFPSGKHLRGLMNSVGGVKWDFKPEELGLLEDGRKELALGPELSEWQPAGPRAGSALGIRYRRTTERSKNSCKSRPKGSLVLGKSFGCL